MCISDWSSDVCSSDLYDDAFIVSRLAEAEWKDSKMPLPTINDAPWGVAVKKGEPAFAALLSGMVENGHPSGTIIELEQKYGLQRTAFAQKTHATHHGENHAIARYARQIVMRGKSWSVSVNLDVRRIVQQ